ncbi:hypothetical protein [Neobacillus drentensis]|uniref:hypothetical protein n=1 Tax=Neobacillus drentensis TaxID=220684 RepID=UPI0030006958
MIIEIDGFFHRGVMLSGKKCSREQFKQKYLQAKELTYEIQDFPKVFCRLYNFEQIPYDNDIEVEFIIDTDTDRIYSPSY